VDAEWLAEHEKAKSVAGLPLPRAGIHAATAATAQPGPPTLFLVRSGLLGTLFSERLQQRSKNSPGVSPAPCCAVSRRRPRPLLHDTSSSNVALSKLWLETAYIWNRSLESARSRAGEGMLTWKKLCVTVRSQLRLHSTDRLQIRSTTSYNNNIRYGRKKSEQPTVSGDFCGRSSPRQNALPDDLQKNHLSKFDHPHNNLCLLIVLWRSLAERRSCGCG
jgi:hypothetical protein